VVSAGAGFQSDGASIIGRGDAVFLCQREYAQHATDGRLAFRSMHDLAQRANMRSCYLGSPQQLFGGQWGARGPILVLDAMPTALLAQMISQELSLARINQPHLCAIPLHVNAAADPTRRSAVIGRFDLVQTGDMGDRLIRGHR
jgi:hypothetical protein